MPELLVIQIVPMLGRVHFFPFETSERFERNYECEPSVEFDKSRQYSLRYLRQFGFCIRDRKRLNEWEVLFSQNYGRNLDNYFGEPFVWMDTGACEDGLL